MQVAPDPYSAWGENALCAMVPNDASIRRAAGEILRRTGGDLPLALGPQDRFLDQVPDDFDLCAAERASSSAAASTHVGDCGSHLRRTRKKKQKSKEQVQAEREAAVANAYIVEHADISGAIAMQGATLDDKLSKPDPIAKIAYDDVQINELGDDQQEALQKRMEYVEKLVGDLAVRGEQHAALQARVYQLERVLGDMVAKSFDARLIDLKTSQERGDKHIALEQLAALQASNCRDQQHVEIYERMDVLSELLEERQTQLMYDMAAMGGKVDACFEVIGGETEDEEYLSWHDPRYAGEHEDPEPEPREDPEEQPRELQLLTCLECSKQFNGYVFKFDPK